MRSEYFNTILRNILCVNVYIFKNVYCSSQVNVTISGVIQQSLMRYKGDSSLIQPVIVVQTDLVNIRNIF